MPVSKLNLPHFQMHLRRDDSGELKVFDPLRKKYVVLTPEENVRQHFINWLINHRHYPVGLVANEVGIKLNNTSKRCDTIVFQSNGKPLMIVEYKAPHIHITQDVFEQIARYNMALKAEYLVVSNGINHYCCKIDYTNNSYQFIPEIPDYSDLINGVCQN